MFVVLRVIVFNQHSQLTIDHSLTRYLSAIKSLYSGGQQLHQYQQNEQLPLTLTH